MIIQYSVPQFQETLKIVAILLCLLINRGDADSTICDNPLGKKGNCIPIGKCSSISKIYTEQPTTDANLFFLQKSLCGIDPETLQSKVCCTETNVGDTPDNGSSSISTVGSRNKEQGIKYANDTPKDVKDVVEVPVPSENFENLKYHRNINLLPNVRLCGYNTASDRIIGGSAAGLGTYPWMVLIGYKDTQGPVQYACGATLISQRYVLTAAHCLRDLPNGNEFTPTQVLIGEYDKSKTIDCDDVGVCAPPVQIIPIEKVIPHEDYNKKKQIEHDIGLIRLTKDAALGPFVSPICLPVDAEIFKSMKISSDMLYVAGWGRTKWDSEDNSNVLQDVLVPLVSNKQCMKVYENKLHFDVIGPGRFCAGGIKDKDSCYGDSGGPIMQTLNVPSIRNQSRAFQFGIVSMGPEGKCGTENAPSLYTRVAYYMPWILDNLSP